MSISSDLTSPILSAPITPMPLARDDVRPLFNCYVKRSLSAFVTYIYYIVSFISHRRTLELFVLNNLTVTWMPVSGVFMPSLLCWYPISLTTTS